MLRQCRPCRLPTHTPSEIPQICGQTQKAGFDDPQGHRVAEPEYHPQQDPLLVVRTSDHLHRASPCLCHSPRTVRIPAGQDPADVLRPFTFPRTRWGRRIDPRGHPPSLLRTPPPLPIAFRERGGGVRQRQRRRDPRGRTPARHSVIREERSSERRVRWAQAAGPGSRQGGCGVAWTWVWVGVLGQRLCCYIAQSESNGIQVGTWPVAARGESRALLMCLVPHTTTVFCASLRLVVCECFPTPRGGAACITCVVSCVMHRA